MLIQPYAMSAINNMYSFVGNMCIISDRSPQQTLFYKSRVKSFLWLNFLKVSSSSTPYAFTKRYSFSFRALSRCARNDVGKSIILLTSLGFLLSLCRYIIVEQYFFYLNIQLPHVEQILKVSLDYSNEFSLSYTHPDFQQNLQAQDRKIQRNSII